MALELLINNTKATSTTPATLHQQPLNQHNLLVEKSVAHFNHFQFFFDSSHIQQLLANNDRRFLQRIFRERSHANVTTFYAIDCEEEEDLPGKFHQLYDAILEAKGCPIRAYQLVVNTLTFYFSRLTWATSVQKYVIQFLSDSILAPFHEHRQTVADRRQHPLFELELLCLLELFVLRYAPAVAGFEQRVNEDMVVQLLTAVREKEGEEYLATFISGPVINHFGCSIELRLRRIVERIDVKVKSFRDPPPFSLSSAGVGRGRRLSLNTSESTSKNGRCGSSVKGTSSEPVASDASTDNSGTETIGINNDDGAGGKRGGGGRGKASTAATKVGTARRRQTQQQQQRRRRHQAQQQQQRDEQHSSSVGTDVKEEKPEEEEDEKLEQKQQQRTQSPPPAKRLRSGSNAVTAPNTGGRRTTASRSARCSATDNMSERSNRSSCCSSNGVAAAARAADCCPALLVATTPNFPITRSATAIMAAASSSSRSSSSTNTVITAASTRSRRTATVRTTATATKASLPPTTRAMHSMASPLGVRISKFTKRQRFGASVDGGEDGHGTRLLRRQRWHGGGDDGKSGGGGAAATAHQRHQRRRQPISLCPYRLTTLSSYIFNLI
ncbi:hypothetical protein niasHT_038499 [Heterodera trifolii]|uniref:Uncharacterized protein n=1 Tax=Heterodera trifolii TaxID=157864 RepID=A0ABD2J1T4_9BILA